MNYNYSRRDFIKKSALFGTLSFLPSRIVLGNKSSEGIAPSEKVNLAVIGVGNQGWSDLQILYRSGLCNVVALCDIDLEGKHTHVPRYIFGVTDKLPPLKEGQQPPERAPHKAKSFTDFRVMFDEMADEIDAVLIATPDHSHFSATMLAMSLGKHVFVEKPLAHTYGQCARMMRLAKTSGVVTQMGNQGFSGANYFQFEAWKNAGVIKDITKVIAAMNHGRRWHGWGQNATAYPQDPMPDGIDWDIWQDSVADFVPFSKKMHPQEWRSWFSHGSGAFGDWGPHLLDSTHHFLELGLPHTITPIELKGRNDLVYPQASTISFDFAARKDMPACNVTWYDGQRNRPEIDEKYASLMKDEKTGETIRKVDLSSPSRFLFGKDLAFQGGSHSRTLQVIPREKFKDMRSSLPKFSQKNSNHYKNFLLACKGEEEARSPFSISGPLTQTLNLGVIAQRVGETLKFDSKRQRITNNDFAQSLIDPAPRKSWEQFYNL